jgi:hypothetical protein
MAPRARMGQFDALNMVFFGFRPGRGHAPAHNSRGAALEEAPLSRGCACGAAPSVSALSTNFTKRRIDASLSSSVAMALRR